MWSGCRIRGRRRDEEREMLSGPFPLEHGFSLLAVSTYGFVTRKPCSSGKFSRKPSSLRRRYFLRCAKKDSFGRRKSLLGEKSSKKSAHPCRHGFFRCTKESIGTATDILKNKKGAIRRSCRGAAIIISRWSCSLQLFPLERRASNREKSVFAILSASRARASILQKNIYHRNRMPIFPSRNNLRLTYA